MIPGGGSRHPADLGDSIVLLVVSETLRSIADGLDADPPDQQLRVIDAVERPVPGRQA